MLFRSRKEYVGILAGYEAGNVTIQMETGAQTFLKQDVAQVRLYVTF